MELKYTYIRAFLEFTLLLIVPYGIEISFRMDNTCCNSLLIVPYGIEIKSTTNVYILPKLLIIPYGIKIR